MPPFEDEQDTRVVDAVLWAAGKPDRYGQYRVAAPVDTKVRWLNKYREVLKPDGTTVATDVQVIAEQTLTVGSILWPGKLSDLGPSQAPAGGLYQVVTANDTSDLKGREVRHEATLMRFRDSLPPVV